MGGLAVESFVQDTQQSALHGHVFEDVLWAAHCIVESMVYDVIHMLNSHRTPKQTVWRTDRDFEGVANSQTFRKALHRA